MQSNNTAQRARQRKALLFLPVVAIPILCCSFYGLGGGQGDAKAPDQENKVEQFNAKLPGAHFDKKKDALVDKLGFYEKADEDSVKRETQQRADPYHPDGKKPTGSTVEPPNSLGKYNPRTGSPTKQDTAANQLLAQLDQLKKIISAPVMPAHPDSASPSVSSIVSSSPELAKAEAMMKAVQSAGKDDPQIEKLDGMLDKILRIQHPELSARDRSRTVDSLADKVESLSLGRLESGQVYDLDSGERPEYNDGGAVTGFQDIDAENVSVSMGSTVIPAVIPEDQVLVSGATIKLRTREDAAVGSVQIPKNSMLFGKVAISGERMLVNITSIRVGGAIFPVDLQVYDLDGMAGIRIPGAISREVAKESAADGVSSLGALSSVDQSIGAQAATAGVQAARTLFSRKLQLVRAQVKAGYEVLIKNSKK